MFAWSSFRRKAIVRRSMMTATSCSKARVPRFLSVANKVASEYKVAKVNVIKDNTYASCEIFISADDPQIKRIVGRLINILLGVRRDFTQYMNQ